MDHPSHAQVRPPAIAGTFYPGNPTVLRSQIQQFLNDASETSSPPKAIIAPHAGYIYSGPVAAYAYKSIQKLRTTIKRVVLLGPAHRVPVNGLAASSMSHFATPLGNVALDQSTIESLVQQFAFVEKFDRAHAAEHSLEIHLPFLQEILDDFVLVPLVVGEATGEQVGAVLETLWGGDETLIVISSDLSHFHNYQTAQHLDRQTAEAIERFDGSALDYESACGRNPIKGLLHIATKHQLQIQRVDLRNSGDTAGSKDRVVGYGSWLLYS